MKTIYLTCTLLIFAWPIKKEKAVDPMVVSSFGRADVTSPSGEDTILVEQRRADSFKVTVHKTGGDDTIIFIITTIDRSGNRADQFFFVGTSYAIISTCGRYQEHGEYNFINNFLFKVTTKSYSVDCGAEMSGTETDEAYLARLMEIEEPSSIAGRETNKMKIVRYDIDGQGKIVPQKASIKDKTIRDRWFGLNRFDKLPREKLRILKNSIFARKGYMFKSRDLKDYFSKMNWYEPRYDNIAGFLTSSDKVLIAYLEQLENR